MAGFLSTSVRPRISRFKRKLQEHSIQLGMQKKTFVAEGSGLVTDGVVIAIGSIGYNFRSMLHNTDGYCVGKLGNALLKVL